MEDNTWKYKNKLPRSMVAEIVNRLEPWFKEMFAAKPVIHVEFLSQTPPNEI